jgi:hypothetical protein
MNNYILYYYLRKDFSSPYYVGYGKPRRVHSYHSRRNKSEILPPKDRRWIVKSNLTKEEAIDLEIKHIALWGREIDGGVLLNENTGGEGKPGGQKTIGFTGRNHRIESKKKISEKTRGKNNPRYGIVMDDELKQKISDRTKEVYKNGRIPPASKLFILTSPSGEKFEVFGKLKSFCKDHNISFATMSAAISHKRNGPRKNGWTIEQL